MDEIRRRLRRRLLSGRSDTKFSRRILGHRYLGILHLQIGRHDLRHYGVFDSFGTTRESSQTRLFRRSARVADDGSIVFRRRIFSYQRRIVEKKRHQTVLRGHHRLNHGRRVSISGRLFRRLRAGIGAHIILSQRLSVDHQNENGLLSDRVSANRHLRRTSFRLRWNDNDNFICEHFNRIPLFNTEYEDWQNRPRKSSFSAAIARISTNFVAETSRDGIWEGSFTPGTGNFSFSSIFHRVSLRKFSFL